MKTTKIKIKSLFGINEINLDNRSIELSGENGTGKSSVLDAIKYALTNKSDRDYVVKNGETEGEILIETDAGIAINRKKRQGKSDYKSIKEHGKEVGSPESFLKTIFTELQLSPTQFLMMDKNEQNRIILDMIEFDWDLIWIKEQFGEIPRDVDYEQNILQVLSDIQSEKGYYFRTRQDINRDARNKKAFITEIAADIPSGFDVKKWESENLSSLYQEIEKRQQHNARIEKAKQAKDNYQNKIRGFEASKEIAIHAIEKEIAVEYSSIEKSIAKHEEEIKALKAKQSTLEEQKQSRIKLAESDYTTSIAKFDGEMALYNEDLKREIKDVSELKSQAEETERMKSFINEYHRMKALQDEYDGLIERSNDLTIKIEKARELPGEILKTAITPVKGLTVKNGVPLINDLPISNLSEGEKLDLCVDVTLQKPESLQIILIDGVEKLSTANRERLYKKCKEHGLQFIATRTTDNDELTVTYLD